jgi:hypothetical protein
MGWDIIVPSYHKVKTVLYTDCFKQGTAYIVRAVDEKNYPDGFGWKEMRTGIALTLPFITPLSLKGMEEQLRVNDTNISSDQTLRYFKKHHRLVGLLNKAYATLVALRQKGTKATPQFYEALRNRLLAETAGVEFSDSVGHQYARLSDLPSDYRGWALKTFKYKIREGKRPASPMQSSPIEPSQPETVPPPPTEEEGRSQIFPSLPQPVREKEKTPTKRRKVILPAKELPPREAKSKIQPKAKKVAKTSEPKKPETVPKEDFSRTRLWMSDINTGREMQYWDRYMYWYRSMLKLLQQGSNEFAVRALWKYGKASISQDINSIYGRVKSQLGLRLEQGRLLPIKEGETFGLDASLNAVDPKGMSASDMSEEFAVDHESMDED